MSDPSVTVAEAFKQFSQTTVSALRAYEHGTRGRLNQAEDDLRTLRHERDDALRDFNACKEQTRAWAAEVDRWKAEADRALVVNQHQADLVAQLRQEAQQWKDQCLRLEETLRGEIKAWKDQFLRIDAEHTRLLNELSSTSSSQATLTTHTPRHVPIIAAASGDSSATSSATKRGPSASSSTARADNKHAYPSPTTARAFPRVVRRVHAVIDVPVKEEDEEDGGGGSFERPDPTILKPLSTPAGTARASGGSRARGVGAGVGAVGGDTRRRKSSASSHHQRSVVLPSDKGSYIDGEESPSDDADGGEYVDEEEVENAIANGTPADAVAGGSGGGGRKTAPWGRKHVRHEPDEEDDELMMYAKDNPHKVRTPYENHQLRRPPLRKNVADAAAQRLSATNPSAQKRRTTETGSGGAVRTKRRR